MISFSHSFDDTSLHVGEVLGHLCFECGPEIFRELEPVLLSGIKDNLERDQDLITDHLQLVEKLSGRQLPDATEHERVYWTSVYSSRYILCNFFHSVAKVS